MSVSFRHKHESYYNHYSNIGYERRHFRAKGSKQHFVVAFQGRTS